MANESRKTRPKILITEDDKENQKYLELVLRKKFEVDFCDSPDNFFDVLSRKDYDLVIMDIILYGENRGLSLTRKLKQSSSYKHIPVVGLSAHVFSQDRKKALEAGIDVYLTKPVENKKLIESLEKLIK